MNLVYDRERIGEYVKARVGYVSSWGELYQAIGLEHGGGLVAGVVLNNYSGADIAAHVAADVLPRRFLRACFRYAFGQLGCRRVSGYVPAKNLKSRELCARLGYTQEGVMRECLPDDDVIVYGMLREECRWI